MKHIRKFNEELEPEKYRRAGSRLTTKFKEERGAKLIDYADEKEFGVYQINASMVPRNQGRQLYVNMSFTRPKAELFFMKPKGDAEDLVKEWKEGGSALYFDISFSFKPLRREVNAKNYLRNVDGVYSNMRMFSLRVKLCDWDMGLEEWNVDQDTGKSFIGTENEHGLYEMFENNYDPCIYLASTGESQYGIFADRQSALKFKRELPGMLEPLENEILELFSVVGAQASDYEKLMSLFPKISINGLYESIAKETTHTNYENRWFAGNQLA